MSISDTALDDKYRLESGRVFLTGVQALARLPMLQRERDRAAGLNTAGYVSGYRGSPLGGLDTALHEAERFLAAHDVRFQPGRQRRPRGHRDLGHAAVAPASRRQARRHLRDVVRQGPGRRPLRRRVQARQPRRHLARTAACWWWPATTTRRAPRRWRTRASTSSRPARCRCWRRPSVQDILDFGLHGWAMSRYTGCWVALKSAPTSSRARPRSRSTPRACRCALPEDFALPADGVHIRWPDPQLGAGTPDAGLQGLRRRSPMRAPTAWTGIVWDSPQPRLGIVACGKAWLDLRQALHDLGIDAAAAAALGLRVYKVGMPWPLEADGARRFAAGLEEILVVEEKRQIIEYQLKEMLYSWRDDVRPRVLGKFDEGGEWPAPHGQWLLPPTGEMTPVIVARAVAARLARIHPEGHWAERADPGRPRCRAAECFGRPRCRAAGGTAAAHTVFLLGLPAQPLDRGARGIVRVRRRRLPPDGGDDGAAHLDDQPDGRRRRHLDRHGRTCRHASTCSPTWATAPTSIPACWRSAPRWPPASTSPTRSSTTTRWR